jgi:dTMP kinase
VRPGGSAAVRGLFITFEGTEGTGKSTQVRLLADGLRAAGRRMMVSREPGGTAFGRSLRGMLLDPAAANIAPWAELFLYLADRAQHAREVIVPALERGEWVICDRFADATVAYQGFGRGLDTAFIRDASDRAAVGLVPDLTLLLDFDDVSVGIDRARRRQQGDGTAGFEDRFEHEDIEFHSRVRDGYRSLAAAEPGRIRLLPAGIPSEELHRLVLAEIYRLPEARSAAGG